MAEITSRYDLCRLPDDKLGWQDRHVIDRLARDPLHEHLGHGGAEPDGRLVHRGQWRRGGHGVVVVVEADDIAVVGFDDAYYAMTTAPPLTTVHQPSVRLGATMAEVLVKRIAVEPVDHVTILPAELVIRQST